MARPSRVVLGRVAGPHGLGGQVRVRFFGDDPSNLAGAGEIWLAEGPDRDDGERFDVVGTGSGRVGEVRLSLEGITDRDAAAALKGRFVLADRDLLEPLSEGDFYWHDLVGCRVEDSNGREIGRVREIWDAGAHDVLVVDGPGDKQHLIPTARELVTEIDAVAQRIVVEVIPGLLD